MKWHYEKGGTSAGPVHYQEIERLFRAGQIEPDTLIWRPGMTKWAALSAVEELKAIAVETPPPLPGAAPLLEPIEHEEIQVEPAASDTITLPPAAPPAGPWTRYFARMIDIAVVGTLLLTASELLALYGSPELSLWILRTNAQVLNILVLPFTMIVTGIIISMFGNSPGKAIFGIKREPINPRYSFSLADNVGHELRIWVRGLGLGFPIITLFTALAAHKKVSRGQPATYDQGYANVRDHSGNKARRIAGMVLSGLIMIGVVSINAFDRVNLEQTARPSTWVNPITNLSTQIPANWFHEVLDAPNNGGKLYAFTHLENGRVTILGNEVFPRADLQSYADALKNSLSANMRLNDWQISSLALEILEVNGQMADGNQPVKIYVAEEGGRFWRIVFIDQVRPVSEEPDDMARALLKSVRR